jgi:hypothetical protein
VDRDHLEQVLAARSVERDGVPDSTPENRARTRPGEGHPAVGRIHLVEANDLEAPLLTHAFTAQGP